MQHKWIVLLVATFFQVAATDDTQPDSPVIDATAPPIIFTDVNGRSQRVDEVVGTKEFVLIFTTSESASDILNRQSELLKLANNGTSTIIIDIDCFSTRSEAENKWKELGLKLPIRYDAGGLSSLFQVVGLPFAIMVDQKGILRFSGGTGRTENEKKTFSSLLRMLNTSSNFDVTGLPISHEGLSHFPKCRGKRT